MEKKKSKVNFFEGKTMDFGLETRCTEYIRLTKTSQNRGVFNKTANQKKQKNAFFFFFLVVPSIPQNQLIKAFSWKAILLQIQNSKLRKYCNYINATLII
jgi:hypothetical protein